MCFLIFCGTRDLFFQDSLMNMKFKRTALLETETFCNFINAFTVTFFFEKCNVSLLNKSYLFKRTKVFEWERTYKRCIL